MNRVERLIAELCPDGAEFNPLSDVTVKSKRSIGMNVLMKNLAILI